MSVKYKVELKTHLLFLPSKSPAVAPLGGLSGQHNKGQGPFARHDTDR